MGFFIWLVGVFFIILGFFCMLGKRMNYSRNTKTTQLASQLFLKPQKYKAEKQVISQITAGHT